MDREINLTNILIFAEQGDEFEIVATDFINDTYVGERVIRTQRGLRLKDSGNFIPLNSRFIGATYRQVNVRCCNAR